jgi:hypothetical protein
VAEPRQAYPLGHPFYEVIRELSAAQADFDELEFGPLFTKHVEVLAITGVLAVSAAEDPVTLTLWRGQQDGSGEAAREWEPLWLRVDVDRLHEDNYEETYRVDPAAAELGLALADSAPIPEIVEACRVLLELLVAAEPTHVGLVGGARQQSFEQLNEAVQDGFDEAGAGLDNDFEHSGGMAMDWMLHAWAAHSGFDAIVFDLKEMESYSSFMTKAWLPTEGGEVTLAAWIGPEETGPGAYEQVFWLEVDGHVQRMPVEDAEDEVVLPGGKAVGKGELQRAIKYLRPMHVEAFDLFMEQMDSTRHDVCSALSTVVLNALNGGEVITFDEALGATEDQSSPGPADAPDWHSAVDEFTAHCKLGFLAGVVVEESLYGKVNIHATAVDPITRQNVLLKVYWHREDDSAEPVHWLAADSATCKAHGGDPMRPELLAGFPQGSRDRILHAIDHLHDMEHLATDVVNAKAADMLDVLESVTVVGDVPELVAGSMQAEAIEDALAGLNGIARLYTGSLPERGLRNS